jgi:ribosomal-protein-alanine N-acetyltransferase
MIAAPAIIPEIPAVAPPEAIPAAIKTAIPTALPEALPEAIPAAVRPGHREAPPKSIPKPAAPELRPSKAARHAPVEAPPVPKAAPVHETKVRPVEKAPEKPAVPPPPMRIILTGPRLDLVFCDLDLIEMILVSDKAALAAALNATIPDGWPVSPEVQPLFRDMIKEDPSASGWLGYAAILRSERQVVGDVGFLGPPDAAGSVEIGYSVVTDRRGRGYASEMVEVLARWAFQDERVRRITAHTDFDNGASMKVLENNGFQRTGTSAFMDEGDKLAWTLDRRDTRLL